MGLMSILKKLKEKEKEMRLLILYPFNDVSLLASQHDSIVSGVFDP